MKDSPLIRAVCLAMPSGENFWFMSPAKQEATEAFACLIIDAWRERHPEFQGIKCNMGCIEIIMPLKGFNAIPNENKFIVEDQRQEGG